MTIGQLPGVMFFSLLKDCLARCWPAYIPGLNAPGQNVWSSKWSVRQKASLTYSTLRPHVLSPIRPVHYRNGTQNNRNRTFLSKLLVGFLSPPTKLLTATRILMALIMAGHHVYPQASYGGFHEGVYSDAWKDRRICHCYARKWIRPIKSHFDAVNKKKNPTPVKLGQCIQAHRTIRIKVCSFSLFVWLYIFI